MNKVDILKIGGCNFEDYNWGNSPLNKVKGVGIRSDEVDYDEDINNWLEYIQDCVNERSEIKSESIYKYILNYWDINWEDVESFRFICPEELDYEYEIILYHPIDK